MKSKSRAVVALTAAGAFAGCGDTPTRPPDPFPVHVSVGPSASISALETIDEVSAGVIVLADAALRSAPALSDTPVRPRLIRELGEAGAALALRGWTRLQRSLDAAESLLAKYAADASPADEAEIAAIQLAIDYIRTLLPQ